MSADNVALNGSAPVGLRTRGVDMRRVRPLRWLWERRIPVGLPSLLVGEESVGKGTLAAWLIVCATRGELPGDLHGEPIRVLIVGDEDGFEPIWVPRLYASGADLEMVRTLDDGEHLDDLGRRAEDLRAAVRRERIGLLLFDQVLDHVPGGDGGQGVYNPKNVRQALMPLRRVAGEEDVAALGLLHPIKGNAASFRQLMAASHQFNAVSRSSLLLGVDPDDDHRRVLVRGKGNHTAAPRSFEFAIVGSTFELNGHGFEMPQVSDPREGDRTVADLLASGTPEAPVRSALADELEAVLTERPQSRAALARAVGRDPKDGSVGNALKLLDKESRAQQDPSTKGWSRPRGEGAGATPYVVAPTPSGTAGRGPAAAPANAILGLDFEEGIR